MKQVISALMAVLFVASFASAALYMKVDPSEVSIPELGSVQTTITVCTDLTCSTVVPSRAVAVQEWCKEQAGDPYTCDAGDVMNTAEISVGIASPTDSNGEAVVTLTHNGPGTGNYHYTICDAQSGACSLGGASVTGDAYVPEMGVVASIAVLGIAGYVIAKNRKKTN